MIDFYHDQVKLELEKEKKKIEQELVVNKKSSEIVVKKEIIKEVKTSTPINMELENSPVQQIPSKVSVKEEAKNDSFIIVDDEPIHQESVLIDEFKSKRCAFCNCYTSVTSVS